MNHNSEYNDDQESTNPTLSTPFHAIQDSDATDIIITQISTINHNLNIINDNKRINDDNNGTTKIDQESNDIIEEEETNNNHNNHHDNSHLSILSTWKKKLWHLYEKECLLVEVMLAIFIAYCYPKLGAVYIHPNVTAHWIAVIIIFCKLLLLSV